MLPLFRFSSSRLDHHQIPATFTFACLHILSIRKCKYKNGTGFNRSRRLPTSFKSITDATLRIQEELRPSLLAMSESTQPSVLDKAQDAASKLAATVADKLNISGSGDVQAKEGE